MSSNEEEAAGQEANGPPLAGAPAPAGAERVEFELGDPGRERRALGQRAAAEPAPEVSFLGVGEHVDHVGLEPGRRSS